MPIRQLLAGLLLLSAQPLNAEPGERRGQASFEQKVVAVLNAGGSADTVQGRLNRIGADRSLTADQRVAIEALRTLVRNRGKPNGVSLAEAEAFAASHPGSPASAILLAEAALASDQPQRSADALILMAAEAGPLVQLVSPAMVAKLADKLDGIADRKRTADLARQLLLAGWSRGSASLRSYLALAVMRDELAAGNIAQARRLLPLASSPASLHLILIDDRLAALRDDVVRLAGPRLERAWRNYLVSTRDAWLERGDLLSATAYAEALKQANRYDMLAEAFIGRFMSGYNCPSDLVARTVAADLADSLARAGRWSKAQDVMRRSGGVGLPTYASLLLDRGQFGQAAALFDRSIRAAAPPKDEDEAKGLAWLRAGSACAAFRAGNGPATPPGDLALVDLSTRLFVLLCLDRPGDAKAALLAALEDEDDRVDGLRWIQPFNDAPVPSRFQTVMNGKIRALQGDPDVAAAVASHGAILDWPLTAAAPQPGELPNAKPPARWRCGDQADWEMGPAPPDSLRLPDSGT